MQQTVSPDLRERLQRVLGSHYRLERELGRGGMGVVYEATDTALERRVAIKAVHPELSHHDAIVRRFLSEARMIAKLRHPSIVTVHAAGGAEASCAVMRHASAIGSWGSRRRRSRSDSPGTWSMT